MDRQVWAGEAGGAAKQERLGLEQYTMSKQEIGTSPALGMRVADLKARMRDARITEHEMKTFHKVAAIMGVATVP